MRGVPIRHTTRHTTRCGALDRITRRRSAPSGVVGFRQRHAGCPKLQILGPLGAFGAAPTRTGDIRTATTQRCGAYGPVSSRLGHTRWHMRVHGASEPSVRAGSHACTKGGHATCKVQPRMRGWAHRQTTRHTTRCGALDRIARRRSAPSGVVGFRRRRAGCPKLQILGPLGGFRGGAYTHGRHPNRNNATVWGVWAHELTPRPHKVAHARTQRLRTVGACGVTCLHQGGHATCKVQRRMRGRAHPAHHVAHHPL